MISDNGPFVSLLLVILVVAFGLSRIDWAAPREHLTACEAGGGVLVHARVEGEYGPVYKYVCVRQP